MTRQQLKKELQSELHRTAAAGPDDRVGRRNVRRSASAAKRACRGVVQAEPVLAAVGICEIWMIKNIKELRTKLSPESLAEMPILGDGEIEVPEAGVGEYVPRHVAELTERRRDHDRATLRVAAEQV